MSGVRPLISTEKVSPGDQIVGALGDAIVPTSDNVKRAGISVALLAGIGILVAIRNPKYALGIMTATLGLSIGAGYVAMTSSSAASGGTAGNP